MRWAADDVARFLFGIASIGLLALLFAASVRYSMGPTRRQTMARRSGLRRLNVKLGQRLEIEYDLLPETKEIPADVALRRILAYQGAVCVDIFPMLRANVPSLIEELADRCRKAEGLGPGRDRPVSQRPPAALSRSGT